MNGIHFVCFFFSAGSTSETLNYVNLTVITNQRCLQDYDPQTVIESTICAAGIQSPAQSSCYVIILILFRVLKSFQTTI